MTAVATPRPAPAAERETASTAGLEAVARAARAAGRAWAAAGIARRLAVLQDAGRALAARRQELLDGLRADGLSADLADYWSRWILRAADPNLLELYARALARWVVTGPGGEGELLVRRADGVVLLCTPANSPTINAATLFSILLPGNAVVVRAPDNDRGLRFIADGVLRPALEAAGFVQATLAVATGKMRDVLARLFPSPDVDTVVFFGNSSAGRAVAQDALAHDKKVVLELDGSDHLVVWRDAPIGRAADSASRAWDFSGQPCPVPKHLLVHGAAFDAFLGALLARVGARARTVEADPTHGTLVPVARIDDWQAALDELRAVGEVRCGGFRTDAQGRPDPSGVYAAPTVVTLSGETALGRPLRAFDREIFFPLVPVVRFDGPDETVAAQMALLLRRSPFGLRASVWSRTPSVLAHFAREVDAVGLLLCNDEHSRTPSYASPWGGPRRSGGPQGESHFFWEKTSRLQAIALGRCSPAEIRAVLDALGCLPMAGVP